MFSLLACPVNYQKQIDKLPSGHPMASRVDSNLQLLISKNIIFFPIVFFIPDVMCYIFPFTPTDSMNLLSWILSNEMWHLTVWSDNEEGESKEAWTPVEATGGTSSKVVTFRVEIKSHQPLRALFVGWDLSLSKQLPFWCGHWIRRSITSSESLIEGNWEECGCRLVLAYRVRTFRRGSCFASVHKCGNRIATLTDISVTWWVNFSSTM